MCVFSSPQPPTLTPVHLMYLVSSRFRQTSKANVTMATMTATPSPTDPSPTSDVEPQFESLQPQRSIETLFFVRVGIFIIWTIVMIASSLYQAFDNSDTQPTSDLLFACVAPLAFICFATQPDVLKIWHIPRSKSGWKKLFGLKSTSPSGTCSARRKANAIGWDEFVGRDTPSATPSAVVTMHEGDHQLGHEQGNEQVHDDSRTSVTSNTLEVAAGNLRKESVSLSPRRSVGDRQSEESFIRALAH